MISFLSHWTIARRGGLRFSMSSSAVIMFLATWRGVTSPDLTNTQKSKQEHSTSVSTLFHGQGEAGVTDNHTHIQSWRVRNLVRFFFGWGGSHYLAQCLHWMRGGFLKTLLADYYGNCFKKTYIWEQTWLLSPWRDIWITDLKYYVNQSPKAWLGCNSAICE